MLVEGAENFRSDLVPTFSYFLLIYCFFTIYSRYLKRVISKRDGCVYQKQVPWFSGADLMRPSGHILLSLLPISGCLISWLLFCAVRFLWFLAYVLITSVTFGVLRSLRNVTFDTYQGALASLRNVWRIFVLEGLLHPHSSIP
jgi:hypothetical protein